MKNKLIGFLVFLIYKSLYVTWRIRFVEPETSRDLRVNRKPYIIAHWHGDIPGVIHMLKPLHAAAIISQSKDGDIVDTLARLLGSKTSRGSSTRGGAGALKGILRLAKEGWTPAIAIDGPKGPRHEPKPGIFEISRLIHAPIVPMACTIDRKWVFHKAWDRTELPKPFAKIVIAYGEPIPAVSRDRDGRDPDLARGLADAMAHAQRNAGSLA